MWLESEIESHRCNQAQSLGRAQWRPCEKRPVTQRRKITHGHRENTATLKSRSSLGNNQPADAQIWSETSGLQYCENSSPIVLATSLQLFVTCPHQNNIQQTSAKSCHIFQRPVVTHMSSSILWISISIFITIFPETECQLKERCAW